MKKHKTGMSKICDDQLHYEWKKMEAKENRTGLNVGKILPTIGDLVLIRTEERSNYNKYRVIEELLSDQTLKIRTITGSITRPYALTVPLVAQSIIQ